MTEDELVDRSATMSSTATFYDHDVDVRASRFIEPQHLTQRHLDEISNDCPCWIGPRCAIGQCGGGRAYLPE
ncbi:hypothetical protein ACWC4D_40435 [Streptomyces sp. NPDC001288]|uniref:hypothetical protein n=1 Tax=Streptomyces sp. NPDC001297 TaxID=3364559 RepID=UPI0036B9BEBC